MYISKVPLNMARPDTIRFISSPYKVHAAVEQSFSPLAKRAGDDCRILWRLDSMPKAIKTLWLYVVSPDKPDFTHVVEQAGWTDSKRWQTKSYLPLLDSLEQGQVWSFRIKANPVRKVFKDQGQSPREGIVGTVQGHVTAEQQKRWMLSRTAAHGFSVRQSQNGEPALIVSQSTKESFSRGQSTVTLATAFFDGLLEITDVVEFRKVLCSGIGRAKSFGCGLLTIVKPAV
ncbi:CRISPR-associated protein, Cse3 family [Coriobacterium glomerans PW2]|uniref:CRISPR-associated protein, Cse3 family n=1 Tax=Coriobacterium glomerans (strain ATCC 49209 / DSM 20642 / JCM 10262 / PW2) TaxID=700015 RepID=F2NAL6_CORGP|nr:type I-E CRISPR-associated protein Cas6/Cse3/CasE [Coriobacterium glomerans]AEB06543.1 CRISPR-associated protein, Cse3 family [Coriobacterium glomerans PW2]